MENTTTLNPVPVVERVNTTNNRVRVEIIKDREVRTTWFTKAWILVASVILMFATCLLIAYLHAYKIFKKIKMPDPFHDSRKHPLNDPHAARG
ncbi:MAG: hypothetical protein H6754_03490 [Candidatus Omnitrophica bacterium]|nr:hypothetical protein [Candidatus Omnitrophota bacterium]